MHTNPVNEIKKKLFKMYFWSMMPRACKCTLWSKITKYKLLKIKKGWLYIKYGMGGLNESHEEEYNIYYVVVRLT